MVLTSLGSMLRNNKDTIIECTTSQSRNFFLSVGLLMDSSTELKILPDLERWSHCPSPSHITIVIRGDMSNQVVWLIFWTKVVRRREINLCIMGRGVIVWNLVINHYGSIPCLPTGGAMSWWWAMKTMVGYAWESRLWYHARSRKIGVRVLICLSYY